LAERLYVNLEAAKPRCGALLCEKRLDGKGYVCIDTEPSADSAEAELVSGDPLRPLQCSAPAWVEVDGARPELPWADQVYRLAHGRLLARACLDSLPATSWPDIHSLTLVAARSCGRGRKRLGLPDAYSARIACIPPPGSPPERFIASVLHEGCRAVEIRLDLLGWGPREAATVAESLSSQGIQVIATLRSAEEGGRYRGDPREKLDILLKLLDHGVSLVDFEYRFPLLDEALASAPGRVIVSAHYFNYTPPAEALYAVAGDMIRREAAVAKIVAYARSHTDVYRLVGLNVKWPRRAAAFPMGPPAGYGRLLALLLGAALVYAPLETPVAPGQVAFSKLVSMLREALGAQPRNGA